MLKRILHNKKDDLKHGAAESDEYTELYGCIETNNWTRALTLLAGPQGSTLANTWYVKRHPNGNVWWKLLPIHAACRRNAPPQVIKALLSAYPESISVGDTHGMLSLHWALWGRSSLDVIYILLEADGGVSASALDEYGRLPLHLACEYGVSSREVVNVLTKANASANYIKDKRGKIPLALVDFTEQENKVTFKEMRREVKAVRYNRRIAQIANGNKEMRSSTPAAAAPTSTSTNVKSVRRSSFRDSEKPVRRRSSYRGCEAQSSFRMSESSIPSSPVQQVTSYNSSSNRVKEESGTKTTNGSTYSDGKPRLALTMTSCSASTVTPFRGEVKPEPVTTTSKQQQNRRRKTLIQPPPPPSQKMLLSGPVVSLDQYLEGYLTARSRIEAEECPQDDISDQSSLSSLTKEDWY